MVYHAITEIYTDNITVIEMLCASLCFTFMIYLISRRIEVIRGFSKL
jgi:hypothetical protein